MDRVVPTVPGESGRFGVLHREGLSVLWEAGEEGKPVVVTETLVRPYRELVEDPAYPGDETKRKLRVSFHDGQTLAWISKVRFVVICAGLQSGKTCFGVEWLKREVDTKGPGDYLAVSATFPLLELKLLPEFLDVFQDKLHLGRYYDSKKQFEYTRQKTRVVFGSATNPESIESATAKAAWLDEPGQKQFRRETHTAVEGRLSKYQGRILYTTTLYTYGWFKTEVIDACMRHDPDYELIQFDSTMNPSFPVAEYERMKKKLPPWLFAMRYQGRYVDKPAGMVYSSFDSVRDSEQRFTIPSDMPVHIGIDFGLNNAAAVFYAQDRQTGQFHLFDVYLPDGGKSVKERVDAFKEKTKGLTVVNWIGGNHAEEEIRQAYRAHGCPVMEPTEPRVATRIMKVYGMHSQGKIKVFSDMREYLDEKMSFSYELDENYQPNPDKIEDEGKYHLMSAEQYIMSYFRPDTAVTGQGRPWAR